MNPVAKHAHTFNKSCVQKDKKKARKKGYEKHKSPHGENHEGFCVLGGCLLTEMLLYYYSVKRIFCLFGLWGNEHACCG